MSGGQTPPPTQTTTQTLSPTQDEFLQLALPGVRSFAASTPQRYQGPTTAGFDPLQTQGQEEAIRAAGDQGNLAGAGKNTSDFWLGGDIWNPNNNAGLRGAIDATVRPINENLTQNILPDITNSAVASGNLGSSRQGVAEGNAIRDSQRLASDAASKLVQNQYDTNVKAQLQALQLLPSTQAAQLAAPQTLSAVGDVRQQAAQNVLNTNANNFNFDQYAPFLQSQEILSLLQGLPGGGVTSTGSVPPINTTGQSIGGGLAGFQIGNAVGGPIGGAVGGAGGALLPFLLNR